LRLVKNPSKRLSDGTPRPNWQTATPPLGGLGARHNYRPKRLSHDGAKEYQRVVNIHILYLLLCKTIVLVCNINGSVARNCYFHVLFLLSFITFYCLSYDLGMHVDIAPWTGWSRIAIPLLQCLIFLATITVVALGAASSAVIEQQWDRPYLEQIGQTSLVETSYTSTHEMKVRM
jgi:hypothetical protein